MSFAVFTASLIRRPELTLAQTLFSKPVQHQPPFMHDLDVLVWNAEGATNQSDSHRIYGNSGENKSESCYFLFRDLLFEDHNAENCHVQIAR